MHTYQRVGPVKYSSSQCGSFEYHGGFLSPAVKIFLKIWWIVGKWRKIPLYSKLLVDLKVERLRWNQLIDAMFLDVSVFCESSWYLHSLSVSILMWKFRVPWCLRWRWSILSLSSDFFSYLSVFTLEDLRIDTIEFCYLPSSAIY